MRTMLAMAFGLLTALGPCCAGDSDVTSVSGARQDGTPDDAITPEPGIWALTPETGEPLPFDVITAADGSRTVQWYVNPDRTVTWPIGEGSFVGTTTSECDRRIHLVGTFTASDTATGTLTRYDDACRAQPAVAWTAVLLRY